MRPSLPAVAALTVIGLACAGFGSFGLAAGFLVGACFFL